MIVGGRGTVALLAVAAGLVSTGCSSGSPSEVRAGAVYDAVLRWFADERTDDAEPLPIFIEPRGEGASIELPVQAEVVDSTADQVDARFIDAREEALISEDGTTVVRDGGILLRLGPVLEEGQRVSLDIDVYVDEVAPSRPMRFELASFGKIWRVVGAPTVITPP